MAFSFAIVGRIQIINRIQYIKDRCLCRPLKQCEVQWCFITVSVLHLYTISCMMYAFTSVRVTYI